MHISPFVVKWFIYVLLYYLFNFFILTIYLIKVCHCNECNNEYPRISYAISWRNSYTFLFQQAIKIVNIISSIVEQQ